jgi:hypothetical protein
MKNTIIMVVMIGTFIATACFLGLIAYLLSDADVTYKEVMSHPALVMAMVVVGWIPSIIVTQDLDDYLKK